MRNRACKLLGVVVGAMILVGCGEPGNPGVVPPTADKKATRDFIENPGGVKSKPSASKKVDETPKAPK